VFGSHIATRVAATQKSTQLGEINKRLGETNKKGTGNGRLPSAGQTAFGIASSPAPFDQDTAADTGGASATAPGIAAIVAARSPAPPAGADQLAA